MESRATQSVQGLAQRGNRSQVKQEIATVMAKKDGLCATCDDCDA